MQTFIKNHYKIILIVILSAICTFQFINKGEGTFTKEEVSIQLSKLDSLHLIKITELTEQYHKMDSSYKVIIASKDSSNTSEQSNKKKNTIIYRTIYKDSIVEKIIENTEEITKREQTIVSLTSSIQELNKSILDKESKYKQVIDSLSKVKVDSTATTKKETIVRESKLDVYANINEKVTQDIKLKTGLDVGAEYVFSKPFYIGADIEKDGVLDYSTGYNIKIKTGIKFKL